MPLCEVANDDPFLRNIQIQGEKLTFEKVHCACVIHQECNTQPSDIGTDCVAPIISRGLLLRLEDRCRRSRGYQCNLVVDTREALLCLLERDIG